MRRGTGGGAYADNHILPSGASSLLLVNPPAAGAVAPEDVGGNEGGEERGGTKLAAEPSVGRPGGQFAAELDPRDISRAS